jgi:transcriptional regulator with XRE-family HTH domain
MNFRNLKPNGFTATRLRLGLSQQQLAMQLGISKAAVGMAETGRRNLPVAALFKLAELEIKMANATVTTSVNTGSNTDKQTIQDSPIQGRSEEIQIRELQCELQIQKLTDSLNKMIVQHKRLHTQLQLLDSVIQSDPESTGNMLGLCMHLHRERVARQLAKCCPTEQALLRNKIALLSAETHLNKGVRQQMQPS